MTKRNKPANSLAANAQSFAASDRQYGDTQHSGTQSGGVQPASSAGAKTPVRKHIPQRTCVVCREKDAKRQLTRVVRADSGVQVDPKGKMNGRGAYLCDNPKCWERALSSDILAKALRTTLNEEDRARLQQAAAAL